jgi:hypothetical protein
MRRLRVGVALTAVVVLSAIAAHIRADGSVNSLSAVQQPVNAVAMSAASQGDLSARIP